MTEARGKDLFRIEVLCEAIGCKEWCGHEECLESVPIPQPAKPEGNSAESEGNSAEPEGNSAEPETFPVDELLAKLSIQGRQGKNVGPAYAERITQWEEKARGILRKLEVGTTGIPPELAKIVGDWDEALAKTTVPKREPI